MPGMNGLEFLEALRAANPDVFVIVMSGYGSIETAVEAMKRGACDFISKPFKSNELRQILEQIEGQLALNGRAGALQQEVEKLGGAALLIGRSPEMQQIYRVIMRAANSSNPVLILGEPGTGRELLARSIHLSTKNCNLPFIPVDCNSLMPKLLESELFGHVKGSFPGAVINKQGLLANAECGTVFLNEVADLSLDAQTKLVRAIEEKAIRPYGSTKMMPLRARIIASSSHALATDVSKGKFRQDLYYRLSVLVLRLPALRERKEDIPLLAQHFLRKISEETGRKKILSAEVLRALTALDWPGNVRELENVLERACALGAGTSIALSDLPYRVAGKSSVSSTEHATRDLSLAKIERMSVLRAIEDSGGDKQKAAGLLGISRTTLYRKLNEYKRSG
jgi:two-component system response regulator HydG